MTASRPDLNAIEARANAATEGPWRADDEHDVDGYNLEPAWCVSATKDGHSWAYDLAYASHDYADPSGKQEAADCTFMAAARTDVPELCAEVRRLQAVEQAVRDIHAPTHYDYGAQRWVEGVAAVRPAEPTSRTLCRNCTGAEWPCATIRALDAAAGGL